MTESRPEAPCNMCEHKMHYGALTACALHGGLAEAGKPAPAWCQPKIIATEAPAPSSCKLCGRSLCFGGQRCLQIQIYKLGLLLQQREGPVTTVPQPKGEPMPPKDDASTPQPKKKSLPLALRDHKHPNWALCIEEPIRDLVVYLRENGVNTTSSCAGCYCEGHRSHQRCEIHFSNIEMMKEVDGLTRTWADQVGISDANQGWEVKTSLLASDGWEINAVGVILFDDCFARAVNGVLDNDDVIFDEPF